MSLELYVKIFFNVSKEINSTIFLFLGGMHLVWFTGIRTIAPDHRYLLVLPEKYESEKGIMSGMLSVVTEWLATTIHPDAITFSTSSIRSFATKEGVPTCKKEIPLPFWELSHYKAVQGEMI